MKKSYLNYAIGIVLLIIATAGVLYLSLKNDAQAIVSILKQSIPLYFLLAISLVGLTHFNCALAIRKLLLPYYPDLKRITIFKTRMLEQFARGVTPLQSGGQVIQVYALKQFGIGYDHSIFALSVDFVIFQFTAVLIQLIFILGYLFKYTSNTILFYGVLLGFIINAAVLAGLFLLLKWQAFHTFIAHHGLRFLHKLRFIKDLDQSRQALDQKILDFSKQLDYILREKKIVIHNCILYLLNLFILNAIPFIMALALRIPIGMDLFFDFMALSLFVAAFNSFIPIPGATGGIEAAFILAYSAFIQDSTLISGMMLGWRFVTYYIFILAGALYFIIFMIRKPKIIQTN